MREHNNANIISLIYFDEMGLAEISPNNPLKVIHSELDYKEEEEIYILHHHWYKELRKKGKIERSKYEDTYGTL